VYSGNFCRYSSFRETKSAKLSLIFDTILTQKTQKKNLDFSWFDNVETTQHSWQKQTKSRKKIFFDLLDIATTVQKKNLDSFAHLPQIVSDWSTVIFQRQFVSQIFVFTWILYWIANSVMRVNSWKHHRQTRNCQNWERKNSSIQNSAKMKFGFGFRSTNSSSGGSSSGGGSHGPTGQMSRGRSSKKSQDDRPFPPHLEEHPYFNYFPTTQQNYYTR
jgi:hypothetical protein